MQDRRKSREISDRKLARYLAGEKEQNEVKCIEDWFCSGVINRVDFLKFRKIWRLTGNLDEFKLLDIEVARKKVAKKLLGPECLHNLLYYWKRIAAVLLIPLVITFLSYLFIARSGQELSDVYHEIKVAYGTTSQLILSDGTKVWINSGSSLDYPLEFAASMREVYLEGEAFFQIAENRDKPFIVRTSHINVEATGTSFNVLAYREDNRIEITLVTGKVALVEELCNSTTITLTEIKPGERVIFDKEERKMILDEADTDKIISWKMGWLVFRNDPMNEVVRKMSRWFNTDIQLMDEQLKSYRYTATFTDETLLQVLELLKMSAPIEYSYIPRGKNADNTFSKSKVKISVRY